MNRDQTGATGRRERKSNETRERIFRAAIELFAKRGAANVTVEQITERADVGKGTFFNYFPNKEAVLTYFGGDQVERLQQAIEAGQIHGTPSECIEQTLNVLALHPSVTPDLARGLFISSLSVSHVSAVQGPSVWHLQEILEAFILEGRERGEFRSEGEVSEVALFLLGQYFLGMLTWCAGFSDLTLPEIVRRYVRMALSGLDVSGRGGA